MHSSRIKKVAGETFYGPTNRKTIRTGEKNQLETRLYKWFLQQRERNAPINGVIIKVRAKILLEKYKQPDEKFNASQPGRRFKKKY